MRPPWYRSSNASPRINPLGAGGAQLRHAAPAAPPHNVEDLDIERGSAGNNAGSGAWGGFVQAPREIAPRTAPLVNSPGEARASKVRGDEVRIEVGEESTQLLGETIMSGLLQVTASHGGLPRRRRGADAAKGGKVGDWACLTSQELTWGAGKSLQMGDVVAVSCREGSHLLTVHAYPSRPPCWAPPSSVSQHRRREDHSFVAPTPEEAWQWVWAFAEINCHINTLPLGLVPLERERAGFSALSDSSLSPGPRGSSMGGAAGSGVGSLPPLKCPPRPSLAVVLNPRSGHGRAVRIFRRKVQPILELAGFKLTVMETNAPRHAEQIAASLDLASCPDGIICVGGDGIVNEVLNGLYMRPDAAEALSVPLGIIPAGSDNSLIWTVLGIGDPVAAALGIVKGGSVALDALLLQWSESALHRLGLTIAYFGFMSDVLELSTVFHKHFGPLRYLVAGFLRFLFIPSFQYDVQFLPVTTDSAPLQADHPAGASSNSNDGGLGPDGESGAPAIDVSQDGRLAAELHEIMERRTSSGLRLAGSMGSADSMSEPAAPPAPTSGSGRLLSALDLEIGGTRVSLGPVVPRSKQSPPRFAR